MTGQFPFKLSRGNNYIDLLYDFDSNTILVEAVPNRQTQTMSNAWKKLINHLWARCHEYTHLVLDNELSNNLR